MTKVIVFVVVLVVLGLVFVRVLVPFLRRTLVRPSDPGVVPGEVVPDPGAGGLPAAQGHGYDRADVDDFLDRVYGLSATASGRIEALELVRTVRFHLARRGGYEPVFVDDRMDAIADALASGRDLPPRPDYR